MGLELRVGDLFECGDADAIAHGCNCAGAMGAGIAVQFKRRWPEMYAEYRRRCADGRFVPGSVFLWDRSSPKVFNLGTQEHWRVGATEAALKASKGALVNISSVNGMAVFGHPAYSAAKAGLIHLTKLIAVEYGKYGIRSNAVAPGTVRTQAWEARAAANRVGLSGLAAL